MRSSRKESISLQFLCRCQEIIVAQRGLQFDPDIVDAFVEKFDAFVAIAERHRDNQ